MTIPDLINGLFEAAGGFFVYLHCKTLYTDKSVKGVSIRSIAFFTCWGAWNCYFYPHLDQWMSFWGGVILVVTNSFYVMMLLYYKYYYKENKLAPPSPHEDAVTKDYVDAQNHYSRTYYHD